MTNPQHVRLDVSDRSLLGVKQVRASYVVVSEEGKNKGNWELKWKKKKNESEWEKDRL